MLITIDGQKGSGKTFLMTQLVYKDFLDGTPIKANYQLIDIEYRHFYLLSELNGTAGYSIAIDEGQKLFHCRRALSLPPFFLEMVSGDRHDFNTIYVSTQNFWHIDKNVRDNTDILYSVKCIFRYPFNSQKKALFQWSKYWKCERYETPSGLIRWKKKKSYNLFITKWSKEFYKTYEKISLARYHWRLKIKNGKRILRVVSRHLIESGRKRI